MRYGTQIGRRTLRAERVQRANDGASQLRCYRRRDAMTNMLTSLAAAELPFFLGFYRH